jgi:predicted TPR repeat methyltransferase
MAAKDEVDPRLNKVYKNNGDHRALFDDWASTYDHDLIDELGYVADAEACRLFESLVPGLQSHILDAGCGTGLVGRRLKAAGYTDIHGNDYSEKMLDKARVTDAYQTLKQHDLTQPIKTDQSFDAAIAVGVFGFNLPSAEHLVNITACLRVGGVAVVTVNGKAWQEVDWESKLENFNQNFPGTRLLEVQTIDYLKGEGIDGRLLTLERC